MILISIIIPVYNVERYVAQCLDSVFNQDLPEDEYEVICVNDGSTDGSREIVSSYLPLHRNLRLIDHPCNMKLGVARNTGRKAANGKYIWNVDSDDVIQVNCLRQIITICERDDLDVLIVGRSVLNNSDNAEEPLLFSKISFDGVNTGLRFLDINKNNMGDILPVWDKICKKSFLDINQLYSPPINMGEDQPFSMGVMAMSNRISYFRNVCYFYRRREDSLSGLEKKNWNSHKLYEASFVCSKYMDIVYKSIKSSMTWSLQKEYKKIIVYSLNIGITAYNYIPEKERMSFSDILRKNIWHNLFVLKYFDVSKCIKYFQIVFDCKILSDIFCRNI